MKLLKEVVSDGALLTIIEGFLKTGVIEDGVWETNAQGTPQGGVISPLLSNSYLDELDHMMDAEGYEMTRYADDMVILCRSAEEAEAALGKVRSWMDKVHLTLHPEKTRLVNMIEADAHFDFLGYRFKRSKRGRIIRLIRPKSEQKFRDSIRCKTRRNNAHSMETIIKRINPILKGWFGYFKQAYHYVHKKLDAWIRMRLRSIYRRRHRKRGRGRGKDHHRWPNRHFAELGLFSLETAHCEARASIKGVKR